MITIIFTLIQPVVLEEFERVKSLYPQFGKVMEGKGYIPSIDFGYAKYIYSSRDDGKNPFFPFALGEIERLQKKDYTRYYREAIKRAKTLNQLFLIHVLLIYRNIYYFDSEIKEKMILLLNKQNLRADLMISGKYEEMAIQEYNLGNIERSLHLFRYANLLAPMIRRIPLEGAKASLRYRKASFVPFLISYINSIKFVNNRYVFYYNLIVIIGLFLLFVGIGLVAWGFVDSISFMARAFRIKTPFRMFWVPGVTWALFVFLPLRLFLIIAFLITLLRIGKQRGIWAGLLLVLSGLLFTGINSISPYLKDNEKKEIILAYYDPVHVNFKDFGETKFTRWLYGIKLLKTGRYYEARQVFKNLKVNRQFKDEIINNIGVSYFLEGKYDSALVCFKEAEQKEKKSPVYIFNMAKTYTNLLEFQKASQYFTKLKGSQKKISDILEVYPPLSWYRGTIFRMRKSSIPPNLLIILIAGFVLLATSIPKKARGDMYCSVCGTVLVISLELEEKKVCEKCYIALAQSHSKGIRERIKKTIKKKADTIIQIKNLIFSILFPGIAHINNGFVLNGLFYSMLYTLLIVSRYSDKLLITESGFNIGLMESSAAWFALLVIFFIFLIISTGRVSEYGSGR
ncbi:tetratricopeptide repeat protein [candidate division WOR-3 bacterium]|nr:tetratricopeptide repeat protein [candidate division WOR-3 bacterium]